MTRPNTSPRLSSFLLTFTESRALAASIGYTLRREAPGGDFVTYPKGMGADSGPAYFDSDAASCLAHAVATCDRAPDATWRKVNRALSIHETARDAIDTAAEVRAGRKRAAEESDGFQVAAAGLSAQGASAVMADIPDAAAMFYLGAAIAYAAAAEVTEAGLVHLCGRGFRARCTERAAYLRGLARDNLDAAERATAAAAVQKAPAPVEMEAPAPAVTPEQGAAAHMAEAEARLSDGPASYAAAAVAFRAAAGLYRTAGQPDMARRAALRADLAEGNATAATPAPVEMEAPAPAADPLPTVDSLIREDMEAAAFPALIMAEANRTRDAMESEAVWRATSADRSAKGRPAYLSDVGPLYVEMRRTGGLFATVWRLDGVVVTRERAALAIAARMARLAAGR